MSDRQASLADRPKVYVREKLSPTEAERFHADPEGVPVNLQDAYHRLREITRHDAGFGAAWKLGGTTPTTRAAFKVDKAYFAPLHADEIMREPKTARLGHLCEIKGEVEIALRLSRLADGISDAGLLALRSGNSEALFDAWCIALEMPASAILNLADAGVNALIADRCAAGALILGPDRPLADRGWEERRLIVLEQDGKELSRGDVTSLVASPVECTIEFCLEARAHGFTPRAGQWISTGGLTPCALLNVDHHITVRHGADIALDFDLRP